MNFKKTIAKTLVAAMAIGSVSVANLQSAKAAVTTITVDGAAGTVTAAGAAYWSVLKEVKTEKQGFKIGDKIYTTVSVEDYTAEGVDAYTALKGKAGVIGFGENPVIGTDWKVQSIGVADQTFKMNLVATTSAVKGITPAKALGGEHGYLVGTIGKGATLKEVDLAASRTAIQVKQGSGDWATIETYFGIQAGSTTATTPAKLKDKLKMLSQTGASLSFRLVEDKSVFPSKEVKVKVAAPAKAPTVKVDVTKGTTGVKAGIEYMVLNAATIGSSDTWKTTTSKTGLTLTELGIDGSAKKVLAVRTAAKGNKIASKVGFITLNQGGASLSTALGTELTSTGKAITVGDGKLEIGTTLAYNVQKGATITNSSTNTDLEFALVPDGTAADKVKWTALNRAKDAKKPTKAALKYSAQPKVGAYTLDNKVKLYVRVAGTKQDKNNVATLAGVSAGAIVKFANIEQKITAVGDLVKATAGTPITGPSIQLGATGAAVVASFTATLSNIQKKGVAPKVKVTAPVTGVTVKAEKVDDTGKVKITVNVAKTAFKTDEAITAANNAKLKFDFEIEGLKDSFAIGFAK